MSTRTRPVRAAGVLYTAATGARSALADFARELKARGWRVGGVIQVEDKNAAGERIGLDAIELDTERRVPLSRPTKETRAAKTCTLDHGALTETTEALRRAITQRVDLLVVEKFGESEQSGDGLADEILAAMAEGIPTLVAVPAAAIDIWQSFTGGMADVLLHDPKALWRWWGPRHVHRDLVLAVPEVEVRRVVIGLNWTLVEGPDGCGLAQSPARDAPGCKALPTAGAFTGRSLAELACLAESWNPFETAIGIAAINAAVNRYDRVGEEINGLDVFAGLDGPLAVIGRFPGLGNRLAGARVVERLPREDELPEAATTQVLWESEGAIVTSSTLVNRSLASILAAGRRATLALVGPGTPLTPRLFSYGLDILSGLVITDPEAAARTAAEGGGAGALMRHGRRVTLRVPED